MILMITLMMIVMIVILSFVLDVSTLSATILFSE